MDGMHDLGGKQGFGQVGREEHPKLFHAPWELQTMAISAQLVGRRIYNMDEYRHAIERMDPFHYMQASYYERVLTAAATLCVEKGVIAAEDLAKSVDGTFALARPIGKGRKAGEPTASFQIGDTVREKDEFVPGHTRMPGYIRGKQGVIVAFSPPYPYPDAAAHGLDEAMQQTFDVSFDANDLWPDNAETASVHVGVFRSYLELVSRA